jgi:hypothetical protein
LAPGIYRIWAVGPDGKSSNYIEHMITYEPYVEALEINLQLEEQDEEKKYFNVSSDE